MDPSHLTQLVELEDNYWWHIAKRKLVLRLLQRFAPAPGRLVEGGIGSGRNLVEFSRLGYDVTGFSGRSSCWTFWNTSNIRCACWSMCIRHWLMTVSR